MAGKVPCPVWGGEGFETDYETAPECCGNTTSSGECRGDCAVPVEVPVERPCMNCGTTGEVDVPPEGASSE